MKALYEYLITKSARTGGNYLRLISAENRVKFETKCFRKSLRSFALNFVILTSVTIFLCASLALSNIIFVVLAISFTVSRIINKK